MSPSASPETPDLKAGSSSKTPDQPVGSGATAAVREYWNRHIHDLEITSHPVGSPGFFADLDQYHFEKLHHLLRLVDFNGYAGRRVLEVARKLA